MILPPLTTARLTGSEGGPISITSSSGSGVAVALGTGVAVGSGDTCALVAGMRSVPMRIISPVATIPHPTATAVLRAGRHIALAHDATHHQEGDDASEEPEHDDLAGIVRRGLLERRSDGVDDVTTVGRATGNRRLGLVHGRHDDQHAVTVLLGLVALRDLRQVVAQVRADVGRRRRRSRAVARTVRHQSAGKRRLHGRVGDAVDREADVHGRRRRGVAVVRRVGERDVVLGSVARGALDSEHHRVLAVVARERALVVEVAPERAGGELDDAVHGQRERGGVLVLLEVDVPALAADAVVRGRDRRRSGDPANRVVADRVLHRVVDRHRLGRRDDVDDELLGASLDTVLVHEVAVGRRVRDGGGVADRVDLVGAVGRVAVADGVRLRCVCSQSSTSDGERDGESHHDRGVEPTHVRGRE